MGPTWAKVGVAEVGQTGTRPNCPLIPNSPEKLQGTRIEPPPSVPSANGVIPAATEAAAPALEPPGVLFRFHGLRVIPVSGLSPTGLQPNSLVVVLPIRMPPAAFAREELDVRGLLPDLQRQRPFCEHLFETGLYKRTSGNASISLVVARLPMQQRLRPWP